MKIEELIKKIHEGDSQESEEPGTSGEDES